MGKKEEQALQQQLAALQNAITQLQNPASNPAQAYLTNQALAGADFFNKGEFGSGSSLPKGMFFDFSKPEADIQKYKKLTNVNQGGTFALANGGGAGGRSQAQALQGKYLSDRFARDTQQNYQDNISNAAGNVKTGLAQAAGAKTGQDSQLLSALTNMYNTSANRPQKPGFNWGGLIGGALGAI